MCGVDTRLLVRSVLHDYGVVTVSRLLKITGLFLQKRPLKEMILGKRDQSL